MRILLQTSIFTGLLATGCHCLDAPEHPPRLALRYHEARYDFTFDLPVSWQGYSVTTQEWVGYPSKIDHGPVLVLRHPQWRAAKPYQDIPIMVFTRSQWEAEEQGKFFPYAGGVISEMWHNRKYVFGIYSRYNADDDVQGWNEADDIIHQNRATHTEPQLYPE